MICWALPLCGQDVAAAQTRLEAEALSVVIRSLVPEKQHHRLHHQGQVTSAKQSQVHAYSPT